MAVNESGADYSTPEDARIGAVYRQAAVEEPPPHLDHRITDHARRPNDAALGPRRRPWWHISWRVPFAAAAVGVICASVVLLIIEQVGDNITLEAPRPAPSGQPRSSPPVQTDGEPGPPVPRESEAAAEFRSRPADAPRQAAKRLDGPALEERRNALEPGPGRSQEVAAARDGASSDYGSDARDADRATAAERGSASGDPGPMARAAAPPRGTDALPATPAPPSVQPVPAQVPPAKPMAARKALPASKSTDRAETVAGTTPAVAALYAELDGQPPGRWIERITALRRDGRRSEADSLLGEFKRRYPNEPLPVSLQRTDE